MGPAKHRELYQGAAGKLALLLANLPPDPDEDGPDALLRVVRDFGPLSDAPFDFDRASVAWVEGFIERQRARRRPDDGVSEGLVNTLGAFLGECLVRATGGAWAWNDTHEEWGIAFATGGVAFPFVKVWKQFEDGVEGGDSILSFYDVTVNVVAPGKLG